MELDPRYIDTALRRWQDYTGEDAVHAETGLTFAEIKAARATKVPDESTGKSIDDTERGAADVR
jgi:hypothetical protein